MAGRSGVIAEWTGQSATITLNAGPGVGNATWHRSQFFIDVTAITPAGGSFNVSLRYQTPDGNEISIADLNTINSTGIVEIPILSAFSAVENIVPEPSVVVLTKNGSATLFAAKVYMFAGS